MSSRLGWRRTVWAAVLLFAGPTAAAGNGKPAAPLTGSPAEATEAGKSQTPAPARPEVAADGTVQVPTFPLSESSLLSPQSRAALKMYREWQAGTKALFDKCVALQPKTGPDADCIAEAVYSTPIYKRLEDRYPLVITKGQIGGVPVQTFVPAGGVPERNSQRVLINLHGGHFKGGTGFGSRLEARPVVELGKFKIVGIDYRLAPSVKFPAASEDVAKVYRVLLKTYKPENIGMFGCSAGGLLTAQALAWFRREKLPMPGAVAMLGSGAAYYQDGDSGRYMLTVEGYPADPAAAHPYFGPSALSDPLAFPILSDEILGDFPPSLLISSTRDLAMSSVVSTHAALIRLGRPADLHIWEGMPHCFTNFPFPEADEANQVLARFFDKQLGR